MGIFRECRYLIDLYSVKVQSVNLNGKMYDAGMLLKHQCVVFIKIMLKLI
jgi:hypothetical protein